MASADTEGQQAAVDANGQSLGEAAATVRPFSDIPGENNISHGIYITLYKLIIELDSFFFFDYSL
jgi:hypothetical protein